MGLSLKKLGSSIWEALTPQNEEAQRRAEASLNIANQRIQQAPNFRYGVLARPQARQQFIQQNQAPQFNLGRAFRTSAADALTRPELYDNAPKINVGSFRGSGLIEDFLNSPIKQARGVANIGAGNFKKGVGDIVTGSIEGPAGLVPIARVAQAGKGAKLLPKVIAGAKTGLIEGGVSGGIYGAGQAASQDASLPDIAKSGVVGGAIGGTVGGVFGGAVPVAGAAVKNRVRLNQVGAVGKNVNKPKVTAKEVAMGKALGMTRKQVVEAKYPASAKQTTATKLAKAQGLDTTTTKILSGAGKQPKQPVSLKVPDTNITPYSKKPFMEVTNRYLGRKQATRTLNTGVSRRLPKMGEQESLKLVGVIEEGADTGNFGGVPEQVRQVLDAKHKQLVDAGVNIGYIKNYFPHRWKNEAKVAQDYQAIKLRNGIQDPRTLPSIQEGLRLGFKPASTNYRQAIQNYLNAADRLLADREYFNNLKAKGLIREAGARPQGMAVIDAPGLPQPKPFLDPDTGQTIIGNYYAEPKTASQLNKLFGEDIRGVGGKTLKITAKGASLAQDVGLAGGIPGTPLNAFGVAQNLRSIMGGSVRAPLKADVLALSKRLTNRYWDKHASDLAEIQAQGIPIRTNYPQVALKNFSERLTDAVESGKSRTKFGAAIRDVWNRAVNDPTFNRFMPIMQTEYYRHVRDNLIRVGVSKEDAARIAGERLVKFEGLPSMANKASRNKTGQDAITTFLFAPKYRESMITFWGNNVKALYPPNVVKALNPKSGQYRNNLIFDAAALGVFLYMDDLNQKHNDGRHLWDNPPGKEDKLLVKLPDGRTIGIPFLSSIATIPRTVIKMGKDVATGDAQQLGKDTASLLGYGVRPIVDAVVNEDYFGNKIRDPNAPIGEQAKQIAGYFGTQYQHPYVKAKLRSKGKPDYQVASEALELPFRFYKTTGINSQLVQKDFSEVWKGAPQADKQAFERWHPGSNEFGQYEDQPDNPAYTRERATALQNDGLFSLEKRYAELQNKYLGKPVDPIFDLPIDLRRKALWKQTLLPGSTDPELSKLYSQPWFQDYQNTRSAYYDKKREYDLKRASTYAQQGDTEVANKIRGSYNSEDNPYPVTPSDLQKTMDYYSSLPKGTGDRSAWIRANPKLWQQMTTQWAAVDDWQNKERTKLGLDTTEGQVGIEKGFKESSSSRFGFGPRKPKTAGSVYKYAVSPTAGGPSVKPKVTVKKTATKAVTKKAIATPKVSFKKSLV